jgi:DNA-binding transcriptional regulator GbsR (MarR family)
MMEEKLLGILYAVLSSDYSIFNRHSFTTLSAQDFDFIKFHFLRGFLLTDHTDKKNYFNSIDAHFNEKFKDGIDQYLDKIASYHINQITQSDNKNQKEKIIKEKKEVKNNIEKPIEQYCQNYSQMIASIKTKEIKKYYEDSRFKEVFDIFQKINLLNS